jgi:hypothetical protein
MSTPRVFKSALFWFLATLLLIVVFTAFGPAEKTLGVNVRVVYLHGAWVWTALAAFIAAAATGLGGFAFRRESLHRWSLALGRTGLLFWITYLPISLWAMQANWNGLFLVEPRWRVAVIFAVGGVLLQAGLTLLESPMWASALNLGYAVALLAVLQTTGRIMHPPSPILNSDAPRLQLFFGGLCALTLLAAWQIVRWLRRHDEPHSADVVTAKAPGQTG